MKLQKLLYYAQAWYLAWYDEPMFNDVVEAWRWGPVVPDVFHAYGGEGGFGREEIAEPTAGDSGAVDQRRLATLEAIIRGYGELTGPQLAELSKSEEPWSRAWGDLPPDSSSHRPIPRRVMKRFYRQDARFGVREPELADLSEETKRRLQRGDKEAIVQAFKEALGQH